MERIEKREKKRTDLTNEMGGMVSRVSHWAHEVTSVINKLCGGREEGVSLSNLPSLHLHWYSSNWNALPPFTQLRKCFPEFSNAPSQYLRLWLFPNNLCTRTCIFLPGQNVGRDLCCLLIWFHPRLCLQWSEYHQWEALWLILGSFTKTCLQPNIARIANAVQCHN